jgi:hypothetical protein
MGIVGVESDMMKEMCWGKSLLPPGSSTEVQSQRVELPRQAVKQRVALSSGSQRRLSKCLALFSREPEAVRRSGPRWAVSNQLERRRTNHSTVWCSCTP